MPRDIAVCSASAWDNWRYSGDRAPAANGRSGRYEQRRCLVHREEPSKQKPHGKRKRDAACGVRLACLACHTSCKFIPKPIPTPTPAAEIAKDAAIGRIGMNRAEAVHQSEEQCNRGEITPLAHRRSPMKKTVLVLIFTRTKESHMGRHWNVANLGRCVQKSHRSPRSHQKKRMAAAIQRTVGRVGNQAELSPPLLLTLDRKDASVS